WGSTSMSAERSYLPHGPVDGFHPVSKSLGSPHWPVDLVLFEDPERPNDWQNVLGLFEFKKPTLNEGISQLEIYLTREPRARFGVWTNGKNSVTIYKLPDGTFKHVKHKDLRLPSPGDNFEQATSKAITFDDLATPSGRELRQSFEALLDLVVARDTIVTRSEAQLEQLCNMLLLKLESDTNGSMQPKKPVSFQLADSEKKTADRIHGDFETLIQQREEIFREEHSPQLMLDDHTIKEIVYAWSGMNMLNVGAEAVSAAFQVFRRANLKAGEGQYFTPFPVVRAAVRVLDIQPNDKIIDPACGTGGFLIEAFRDMASRIDRPETVRTWAHRQVHGVDKDSINVKLTRAMMMVMGDGSAHIHIGDSLREDRWSNSYSHLTAAMRNGAFTVVLTNPPFGEALKISARECELNKYTISWAAGKNKKYKDLEIGLVFLERAYRLLGAGGRVGIILPETYFFSSSYSWLSDWMATRFITRGVINVPMEAFQGFCRAKTNLYFFEKIDPKTRSH
ncbi:class I SAM-dependent DNA methyltransferase, partial [Nocardiopsis sp. CNR-923]|uniref:HsdM family class I SAM-dependent methyltransferase n=1 Tax=Nocardiopsis sp. CNR-923 TaxID=1904965 RepID=UPI0021CC8C2B